MHHAARGAYYLAANVSGAPARHGIRIEASNFTIDLSGFALIGVISSPSGITCGADHTNITIGHGVARSWQDHGVNLSLAGPGVVVESVVASNTGGVGIRGSAA